MPVPELPWAIHEDEWDTADGGVGHARRAKQALAFQNDWVLESPASFDSIKLHREHRQSLRSRTAETVQSTPVQNCTPQSLWEYHKGTPSTEATSEGIPPTYLKVISDAFGSRADLHSDVLGVPHAATPREIRIAYFRRGRETLSERPSSFLSTPSSASIAGAVTDTAKLRFQAVSMAYEIISNPAWFDTYENCRAFAQEESDDDDDDEADVLSSASRPRSVASMSALRRTSSKGSLPSQARSVNGVRWNEEVEEVIFNQDPEELSFKTDRKQQDALKKDDKNREKKKKKKHDKKEKKKKKKKRIAVEADNLEQHLEQLNKEAEKYFVDDFLDDLERSIDEFLNFKGSDESFNDEGGDDEEPVIDEDEDEDDNKEEPIITSERLFPELEVKPLLAEAPRKWNQEKNRTSRREEIDDADFEIAAKRALAPKKASLKFHTNHTMETMLNKYCDDPTDASHQDSRQEWQDDGPLHSPRTNEFISRDLSLERVQHSGRRPPTVEPCLGVADKSEQLKLALEEARAALKRKSPLESSMLRNQAQTNQTGLERPGFVTPTDIEVMKTTEKFVFDDGQSAAITVDDTISTLSASVVQRYVHREVTNSRNDMETSDETFLPDSSAAPAPKSLEDNNSKLRSTTPDTAAISPSVNSEVLYCQNFCVDGDFMMPSSPGVLTARRGKEEPDFAVYLMAYLREINNDLKWLGESIQSSWKKATFMDAVTISENDLDGMLGILKTEMEEIPVDITTMQNESFEWAKEQLHSW